MLGREVVGVLALLVAAGCGRIGFEPPRLLGGDAGTMTNDAGFDATTGPVLTHTFGEGPGTDTSGVTADTSLISQNIADGCGACSGINGGATESGLLRFDTSAIAAGSAVVDATIELWLSVVHTPGGSIDIFIVAEAWDEGTATSQGPDIANWTERQPGVLWSDPGVGPGSRSGNSILTAQPVSIDEAFSIPIPAAVAQKWVDEPGNNFGILIKGRDYPGTGGDHPHFFAWESPQAERRPLLRINYRAP